MRLSTCVSRILMTVGTLAVLGASVSFVTTLPRLDQVALSAADQPSVLLMAGDRDSDDRYGPHDECAAV